MHPGRGAVGTGPDDSRYSGPASASRRWSGGCAPADPRGSRPDRRTRPAAGVSPVDYRGWHSSWSASCSSDACESACDAGPDGTKRRRRPNRPGSPGCATLVIGATDAVIPSWVARHRSSGSRTPGDVLRHSEYIEGRPPGTSPGRPVAGVGPGARRGPTRFCRRRGVRRRTSPRGIDPLLTWVASCGWCVLGPTGARGRRRAGSGSSRRRVDDVGTARL